MCGDGGDLVCCDFCACAYHGPECLQTTVDELPDPWECPKCAGTLATFKELHRTKKKSRRRAKKGGKETEGRATEVEEDEKVMTGAKRRGKNQKKWVLESDSDANSDADENDDNEDEDDDFDQSGSDSDQDRINKKPARQRLTRVGTYAASDVNLHARIS